MRSLFEIYREHQGKVSDKWSIYLAEYDRLFSSYRGRPVRLLEIGIQNGGSLEIWSKYFPGAQALVGCDINPDCAKLTYEDSRINVVVGDANTDVTEAEILARSPNFDLIIDDGSHTSGDIVKSFSRYFRHLSQGGIFVAEDLHCSYWSNFEGGLYYPYSSISFFKRLADVVNHEHWGIEKERKQLLQGFAEHFLTDFDESDLEEVHSIEFFNSVCVVHKRSPQCNVLGERFIAGKNEVVIPGLQGLVGHSLTQPQLGNPWAQMTLAPEEDWERMSKALPERDVQIASLNQSVAERDVQIARLNQSVAERDGQIASLKQAVADRDAQIASLHLTVTEIHESTSWRMTEPVRFIGQQIHRINILRKGLPYALKMSGGVLPLFKHAYEKYQLEGWGGIKRRVIFSASPGSPTPVLDYPDLELSGVNFELFKNDYDRWVKIYSTLTEKDREKIKTCIKKWKNPPLVSILMPVFNPPINMLNQAINSVQKQLYPFWELCIADDASTDLEVRSLLEDFSADDSRIRIVFREKNGHISAASNSALDLVNGQYVALLDNDDLLTEHALFWAVDAIIKNPEAGLIYSDEDKITEEGRRFDPYFKPDWNPDLFLSHNMVCHLGIYRTELVKELGGFRVGYEGAQDYDLALRCVERLEPRQIIHIPRVLYHWRSHPGSTAQAGSEKSYALLAGARALNDHFSRTQVSAAAELLDMGMYRARYTIPAPVPLISLIIPTRNGLNLLRQCIDSIFNKTTYKNYEIVIVDNGSDDSPTLSYFESLAADGRVRILRDDRPFNYSALNNAAVRQAKGEYIGLINNDIEVISPDWLEDMMSLAIQPNVGAVGARLWYPNNTLQHGGVITGLGGVAGHSHKYLPKGAPGYFYRAQLIQTLSAVTAACLIVKKAIYQEIGGLDEVNLTVAFNDVDFCLRLREAGYRNVWTPYAELYHHESATRGAEDNPEKQRRFVSEVYYMKERWGESLKFDPAYSVNLTLDREDFSLAWPPRLSRA